ncbi:hypothetical protein D3C73_732880 [compost metagenome]
MIGWLIVACEVAFWIFIIAGLLVRYRLRKEQLGNFLLLCTPIIDLILIVITVIDLQNGAQASFTHALAAIYVGVTVAYGKGMIKWADQRYLYMFAKGPKPMGKPKHGKERAIYERIGWYKHLLAYAIGSVLLLGMVYLVGSTEQTQALQDILRYWPLILAIDFLVSFSYTLWPKPEKEKAI